MGLYLSSYFIQKEEKQIPRLSEEETKKIAEVRSSYFTEKFEKNKPSTMFTSRNSILVRNSVSDESNSISDWCN